MSSSSFHAFSLNGQEKRRGRRSAMRKPFFVGMSLLSRTDSRRVFLMLLRSLLDGDSGKAISSVTPSQVLNPRKSFSRRSCSAERTSDPAIGRDPFLSLSQ